MEKNYTKVNQESIYNYYSETDDTADAAGYLKAPSSFRSFKEGLTEMIRSHHGLPESIVPKSVRQAVK